MTTTLPAGTLCHRNGIPFVLKHDTPITAHPANIPLMGDVSYSKVCETDSKNQNGPHQ